MIMFTSYTSPSSSEFPFWNFSEEILANLARYLFEKQDYQFVRELEANLEMARTCLHYLSFNIFEVDFEPDMIKENILSGSYRLHWFAASQWIVLVQNCAKLLGNRSPPESLLRALSRFAYECENGNYEAIEDFDSQQSDEFKIFRESAPNIHKLLHQELQFRRMDVGDWKLEEEDKGIHEPSFVNLSTRKNLSTLLIILPTSDDSWTNLDPFFLSYASLGIYEQFESLLCPKENHMANCSCPKLTRLYGGRLFRCKYNICQSQQISFKTRSSREAHCRVHDRAYKCTHPSCDFSTLGFSSSGELTRHLSNCHPHAPPKPIQLIKDPDDDELVPLLSDMIAMGMTAQVEAMYPRFKQLHTSLQKSLIEEAAFSGTLQIFQCLSNQWKPENIDLLRFYATCAEESIKGENVEILKWFIPEILVRRFSSTRMYNLLPFMKLCANTESAEVFEIWKLHLKSYRHKGRHLIEHILNVVRDPAKQERLASTLSEHALRGHLTTNDLSRLLKAVASSTCSVSIAKVLLGHGAIVDFRGVNGRGNELIKTPLIAAAAKRTSEGAQMMKLLLLSGADPNALYRQGRRNKQDSEQKSAGMEMGAKEVSKWLGMTWDELVEWATEQRSRSTR